MLMINIFSFFDTYSACVFSARQNKPNFLTEVEIRAILIEVIKVCPKGVTELFLNCF